MSEETNNIPEEELVLEDVLSVEGEVGEENPKNDYGLSSFEASHIRNGPNFPRTFYRTLMG